MGLQDVPDFVCPSVVVQRCTQFEQLLEVTLVWEGEAAFGVRLHPIAKRRLPNQGCLGPAICVAYNLEA